MSCMSCTKKNSYDSHKPQILRLAKQHGIQTVKEQLEFRCGRKLSGTLNDINNEIDRFFAYADTIKGGEKLMNVTSFREMLGILGNFELSARMFSAIDENHEGLISLEQLLVYNDKINHGNQEEKVQLTFRMIDLNNDEKVDYSEFKQFWLHFIEIYSIAAIQSDLYYSESLIKFSFEKISKKKDSFSFKEFCDAKKELPELFECLEQPGKFIKEIAVRTGMKTQKIEFKVLEDLFELTLDTLTGIEDELNLVLGKNRMSSVLRSQTIKLRGSYLSSKAGKDQLKSPLNIAPVDHFQENFKNYGKQIVRQYTLQKNLEEKQSDALKIQGAHQHKIVSQRNPKKYIEDQIFEDEQEQQLLPKNKKHREQQKGEEEKLNDLQFENSQSSNEVSEEENNHKEKPFTNSVRSFAKKVNVNQNPFYQKGIDSLNLFIQKTENQRKSSQQYLSPEIKKTEKALNNDEILLKKSQTGIFGNSFKDANNILKLNPTSPTIQLDQIDVKLEDKGFSILSNGETNNQIQQIKNDKYKNELGIKNPFQYASEVQYATQSKLDEINDEENVEAKFELPTQTEKLKNIVRMIERGKQKIKLFFENVKDQMSQHNSKLQKNKKEKEEQTKGGPQKNNNELQKSIAGGGQFIRLGHEKFDLILNIMIGIKKSMSNLIDIPLMDLNERWFRVKYKTENLWIANENNRKSTQIKNFQFIDFAPMVFYQLRKDCDISNDEYLESLGPDSILNCFWTNNYSSLYELCSSGKSGSLFYYTEDQKYMLKTISHDEFKKLKSMLLAYFQHLKQNPFSLITRFFGLHKITWRSRGSVQLVKKYLVIMNNIFKNIDIGDRFDLKGSTVKRQTLADDEDIVNVKRDKKIALKDLDFNKFVKEIKFKADQQRLLEILEKDAIFFAGVDVIDYSVLLGKVSNTEELMFRINAGLESQEGVFIAEDGQAYIIGIIDILTEFNGRKRMEFYYKRLQHGNNMSCIPPTPYARRFADYMKKIFKQDQTQ